MLKKESTFGTCWLLLDSNMVFQKAAKRGKNFCKQIEDNIENPELKLFPGWKCQLFLQPKQQNMRLKKTLNNKDFRKEPKRRGVG